MAMETSTNVRHEGSQHDDMSKKVKRVAVVVPTISLLAGMVAMTYEPRYGLFAVALILGWTQLVGL